MSDITDLIIKMRASLIWAEAFSLHKCSHIVQTPLQFWSTLLEWREREMSILCLHLWRNNKVRLAHLRLRIRDVRSRKQNDIRRNPYCTLNWGLVGVAERSSQQDGRIPEVCGSGRIEETVCNWSEQREGPSLLVSLIFLSLILLILKDLSLLSKNCSYLVWEKEAQTGFAYRCHFWERFLFSLISFKR